MFSKYHLLSAAIGVGATLSQASAKTFKDSANKAEITVDVAAAPDLADWAEKELSPAVAEWYPKIVEMLKSDGFTAPDNVKILFRDGMNGVPAWTQGNQVSCNIEWYKKNLKGEAKGATIHELVHVVQQYHRGPNKIPGWLSEGIPDYIRWFLYEPESRGAELSAKQADHVNYDGSYRVTANFIHWVVAQHPVDVVAKLNAAAREGKYEESLWKTLTGKSVQELGAAWKENLAGKTVVNDAHVNTLTEQEKADGWQLLFNGKTLDGWNNFKTTTIKPGWQVKDGNLVCEDPHNASDLCTKEQYDWFELQLDYNISEGGNSGIIFHVTEDGGAVWATGPEFQLEDNAKAADPQRCGWLYGLYQPENDPTTGKPRDATKPAGQWNHVRLLVTKEKVVHEINGDKYFEYQLGSEDFKKRVAASKFGAMPMFAKFDKGFLALQGDHGQVSFRNIKLRPVVAKP